MSSFQTERDTQHNPRSGDCNSLARVSLAKTEPQGVKQMATPAELRTPNMHRAKRFAPQELEWKHGDSGYSVGHSDVTSMTSSDTWRIVFEELGVEVHLDLDVRGLKVSVTGVWLAMPAV
jgi:hypothetical protein